MASFSQASETQTGFLSSQSSTAEVFDIDEIQFLIDTRQLTQGKYYIIRPCVFDYQKGTDICFRKDRRSAGTLLAMTNNLFKIKQYTSVEVLVRCNRVRGLYTDIEVIEIVLK
jgi:hypothetical protein